MISAPSIAIEPLAAGDVALVAGWLSAPETNSWLTSEWRGRTIDPVVMGLAMRNKKNRFYLSRCEGEPCGLVALADIDPVDRVAMVWYALGRKNMGGKGVTSLALRQLVTLAFTDLGIECLYAWIIEDNTPSRRVLERVGFREAGTIRNAVGREGVRLARRYFDLTKADLL